MKKPLADFQAQLKSLQRQQRELEIDVAQVMAEALQSGYSIVDILDNLPDVQNLVFDL